MDLSAYRQIQQKNLTDEQMKRDLEYADKIDKLGLKAPNKIPVANGRQSSNPALAQQPRVTVPKQVGIGFNQTTTQPLPYAKPTAETLQKAQQIGQQAQGKSAQQIRQQNLANINPFNKSAKVNGVGGANAMAGLGQFNSALAKTADFILPDVITPKKVQGVLDYYKNTGDQLAQHAAKVNEDKGVPQWAGQLMQGTVAALPNAALAMMSGGTSLGAQALGQTSTGLAGTISTAMQTIAKTPTFYTSLAQTMGPAYEEAKENGASELEAQAVALIGGFVNAGIEIGGGVETVAANPRSLLNWVRSMVDEGKEEVLQGIVDNLMQKATYDKDKKWVSATDETAVINPKRMASEFGAGAAIGGILGGGQMVAGAAVDRAMGVTSEASVTRREQRALDALSKKTGMSIQLDDDIKGSNGYYDAATNTMHISRNSNNGIYQVGAHEITHAIKAQNNEEWNQLLELANANLSEEGRANLEAVLQKTGYSGEQMQEEVVAHYVQQCVTDIKSFEQLVGVNRNLAQRIVDAFESFVRKLTGQKNIGGQMETEYLRTVMGDITPEQAQQTLAQMKKALAAGSQITKGEETVNDTTSAEGGGVEISSETGTAAVAYSKKTWDETDKQKVVDDLVAKNKVSEEKAWKWVNDVNSISKKIADDVFLYDYEANPIYSALKKNSEYIKTVDMSTNCKKRLFLAGTIDEIQRRLPNTALTGDDYIRIRELMSNAGYEVSCGFCYVESRRKHLGAVAEQFVKRYGDPTVTISDITTEAGINYLQQYRPEVYDAFVEFNNKRGSGKVNLVQSRTEYNREIMDTDKDRGISEADLKKINARGGLRVQSYSDFETPHLIDMMQIVIDMNLRGLMSQAYTKVPNFADAMGLTGMKINLSLVVKGLDENGNLVFDGVEGMPIEEAMRLREKYPETVGTILVGKDDATIFAAMADPRIDFIIPYHRSGWAQDEYEALGLVGYRDYTDWQSERLLHPYKKNGKSVTRPKEQFYPGDYWDYSKTGKENAEIYLKMCADAQLIPKFNNFLVDNGDGSWSLQPDGSTDGYWKTLIDFKMYDNNGVGVPQRVVKPEFDPEVLERIMNEYKGDHRNTQVAQDIVEQFLAERQSRKIIGNAVSVQEAKQAIEKSRRKLPFGPSYKATNSPVQAVLPRTEEVGGEQQKDAQKPAVTGYGGNTVGAAESNPSSYAHLQNKYGTIKPGENPSRVVDVPKKDADGNKVGYYARTMMESPHANDEFIKEMEEAIASGEFSGPVVGDKAAIAYSERELSKGAEYAFRKWDAVSEGDKVATKYDLALGQLLLANAMKDGNIELAMKLAAEVNAEAHRAGQNLQSFRLLKKMTPEGMLYYLQKTVDNLNSDFEGRKGFEQIKIDEGKAERLSKATTRKEMNDIVDEIKQDIADQTPVTWYDKWNAWRYLSMLGNPTTQVRNVMGNALFVPVVKAKNLIATGIEAAWKKSGHLPYASKAVLTDKDKGLVDFADKDFANVVQEIQGGGKYSDKDDVLGKRQIFENRFLEGWRNLTNTVMDKGDEIFSRQHYKASLAQYMKANGLNPNSITPKQLNKARQYAIQEAQRATYRDASSVASLINQTKRRFAHTANNKENDLGKRAAARAGEVLLEGFVPFTKTPVNIVKRGIEYSPIGLVQGTVNIVRSVKNGEVDAAAAIDRMAAGLTGSGLLGLGAWLASLGLVSGGPGEDDREEKYKGMLGEQNYALDVGKLAYKLKLMDDPNDLGTYTIDWMAPEALPFFTGVELYQEMQNKDGITLADTIGLISAMSDPIVELSMLSSMNSTFESIKYSQGDALSTVAGNLITSYLGQGVPTIGGKVARTVDETSRQTYYDPNKTGVVKSADVFRQKAQAKIPFAANGLPERVDLWGRTEKNAGGNIAGRFFYNMLSPGYAEQKNVTKVDKELQRLAETTGDSGVFPDSADKTFQVKGKSVKLDSKQYTQFAKTKGQTAFEILEAAVESSTYKKMSDAERADFVKDVYEYAKAKAKAEVSSYQPDGKNKKIAEAEKKGIKPAQYLTISGSYDKDGNGSVTQEEAKAVLDNANLTTAQKAYLWKLQNKSWKSNPYE